MSRPIVLASSSEIRRTLLEQVGLTLVVDPARVDEEAVRQAMMAEGHPPRDLADALAEAKARRVAHRHPGALVIGSDQVLDLDGVPVSKAETPEAAVETLTALSGRSHKLHAAAVIYEDGRPVWRHIATATLAMRDLGGDFIAGYVDRNWDSVRYSVGCYKIEEEGPRLFTRIDGSHFAILGLPLLELLSYLNVRGVLTT